MVALRAAIFFTIGEKPEGWLDFAPYHPVRVLDLEGQFLACSLLGTQVIGKRQGRQ